MNYWTRVLLDQALHLGALYFCLLGKRLSSSGMTYARRHSKNGKMRLISAPILWFSAVKES